jgi:hypothetical protein
MRIGDLLPYLPLASAVLVGLVAAWFGRNGWKWATLTFFAAFAVFFLAITPLNKSAAEVLKALPFVVLVLAALLARRLWAAAETEAAGYGVFGRICLRPVFVSSDLPASI